MSKWNYGDCWDQYPIKQGETWKFQKGEGRASVTVCDITNPANREKFRGVDLVYVDPPWGQALAKGFYTKAGIEDPKTFAEVLQSVVSVMAMGKVAYCEMGNTWVEQTIKEIERQGMTITHVIPITYYKKHPATIIRAVKIAGSYSLPNAGEALKWKDDSETPEIAIQLESWAKSVADCCTGLGGTGIAAMKLGRNFIGTELNKRRLANLISWYGEFGAQRC